LVGWLPAGLVAAVMAPVLAATISPPVEWDARAIRWFHGLWFWQGGDAVARAMANPAFSWSHQEYPPLYPASSGALWSFYDPADRALAKALGSGLTFGAVLVVACLLVTLAPRRLRWPTAAVAGLLGAGLFGIGHGNGTAGHVDLLWAASYGAAALALLVAPVRRDMIASVVSRVLDAPVGAFRRPHRRSWSCKTPTWNTTPSIIRSCWSPSSTGALTLSSDPGSSPAARTASSTTGTRWGIGS
jgi:hypothetical protein